MQNLKNHPFPFLFLLILLLVACTPTTETAPPTTAPALNPVTVTPKRVFVPDPDTSTKAATANNPTESGEPNAPANAHTNNDILLVYERSGGLMGIGSSIITWTLYADGTVLASDGRSWQVDPQEITALVDGIMALGFADFNESYIPKDTCCDRATHTITIYQNGETYQVSVLDSADAPAELYQALDLINEFLIALPTT